MIVAYVSMWWSDYQTTLNWLPTEEEKPVTLQRPNDCGQAIGWKALTAELP